MKLAVIADDLTGANDTGVQFAKQGLDTTVLFSDTKTESLYMAGDVIVLNSDSRALEPQKSYEVVFELAEQLKKLGVSRVFKKIDSTMRGNIGLEIDAVMDVFHFKTSFVVPAFPKGKRITINGKHYVNEVPLDKTEIASDPTCPVNESYLPKLLQEQSKREVGLISIDEVRKGKSHLTQILKEMCSESASNIIVIDATTDDELKIIVETVQAFQKNVLWVGSAGIAYHLCHAVQEKEVNVEILNKNLPVLVVAGSVNSVTHQQIIELKKETDIEEIVISPELFFRQDERQLEIEQVVRLGRQLLEMGNLIISTNRDPETINEIKKLQNSLHLTNFEVGRTIADAMGEIAGQLLHTEVVNGAILTGGDIAGATCKVLNGKGIRVVGEVEDGIPFGKLFGGRYDGLPLVTKAGAFGTKRALIKALQTLSGINEHV